MGRVVTYVWAICFVATPLWLAVYLMEPGWPPWRRLAIYGLLLFATWATAIITVYVCISSRS